MGYRVAVLTDIHGNIAGFEAALKDARLRAPDALVLAGDLVCNGSRPREVLELVQAERIPSVLGNMDQAVVEGAGQAALWSQARVGEDGLAFLRALPLTLRLTPPGGRSPADDLLVAHSTPRSNEDLLILALNPPFTNFQETTPPEEAAAMLGQERFGCMAYGHIHYFSSGTIAGRQAASIGSAGFPFDGDHRAAYGLLTWEGDRWTVEPVRVDYDWEGAARDIERSGEPSAACYAARVRQARFVSLRLFQSLG